MLIIQFESSQIWPNVIGETTLK